MADFYARSEGTGTVTTEEQSDTSSLSRCLTAVRRFFTFLFSHIGLLALVMGYCILGGLTFEHLERENEIQVKKDMTRHREELGDTIWSITTSLEVLKEENWTGLVEAEMKRFEKEIIHAMKARGWDGSEDLTKQRWTFPGSLFYSIVLISTIGYGDQTPKTQWGKLVTIIYALCGIPLFFLCLGHIGQTLSRTFRFLYWRVFCAMCNNRKKKVTRRCRTSIRAPPGAKLGPRQSLKFRDNMSMGGRSPRLQRRVGSLTSDEVISSFNYTVSNFDNEENDNRAAWVRREFKPREQTAEIVKIPETEEDTKKPVETRFDETENGSQVDNEDKFKRTKSTKSNKSLTLPLDPVKRKDSGASSRDFSTVSTPTRGVSTPRIRTTGGEYFHEFEYQDWEEVDITKPIPIWICLLLVFGILFGGAFMFIHTQQWDFLNSIYFCFVTLSTIGFGDFVPKNKNNQDIGLTEDQTELVNIAITALYMIFGLSLFFMICALVQEEVKNKVKNIAIQLGIVKTEDDDYLD